MLSSLPRFGTVLSFTSRHSNPDGDPSNGANSAFVAITKAYSKLKSDGFTDAMIVLNEGPAQETVVTGEQGMMLAAVLMGTAKLINDTNRQEIAAYVGRKIAGFINRPAGKPVQVHEVSSFSRLYKPNGETADFLNYRLHFKI